MTITNSKHPNARPAAAVSDSRDCTQGERRAPRSNRRKTAPIVTVAIALALATAAFVPDSGNALSARDAGRLNSGAFAGALAARSTAAPKRLEIGDSLLGRSRKLRARFVSASMKLPILRELFGDSAATHAGLYAAHTDEIDEPFNFITLRPFSDKVAGRIGSYNIGFFPSERRAPRSPAYNNPAGFIEVTSDNQSTSVSQHFMLSDFLTHDQVRVWPKYLVLREPLLDKLELVIAELGNMGIPVKRLKVMSGFRTPQYNEPGVGAGGRAQDSRHQYGDAADVYVVNGSRDWMSDINRDGRVDTRDARLLAQAAERVEKAHPDLIGGIGIYAATSAHGPFVHIDVRGVRARW